MTDNFIGPVQPGISRTMAAGVDIQVAKVKSDINPDKNGRFLCEIAGGDRWVSYVSPYAPAAGGGIYAIPGPLTEILVIQPSNEQEKWYYMGSIVGSNMGDAVGVPKNMRMAPDAEGTGKVPGARIKNTQQKQTLRNLYAFRERPMQIGLSTPRGHRIILSDQYDPENQNTFIKMRSAMGKEIILTDSKQSDHIKIKNENGDYIKLSSGAAAPDQAANAIDINTRGPHRYVSRSGSVQVLVGGDGGNLDLINNATGSILSNILDTNTWGKINLMTTRNDINLAAGQGLMSALVGTPSINLTTLGWNSGINLNSLGSVNINGAFGVDIMAAGPINLTSLSYINMSAPLINLNPFL